MEASEDSSRKRGGASIQIVALFAIGAAAFLLSSSSASSADPMSSSTMRRVLSEDTSVIESTAPAQNDGVDSDTSSTDNKNYGPSYASQLLEPIDYFEVCFVKSVYSANPENFQEADEIPSISPEFIQNYPQVGFFLFTNIMSPEYAQGWTKLNPPEVASVYARTITQSRYGKFMAWQEPAIGNTGKCRAVVYTDGFHAIRELAAPGDNAGDTIFKSLHSSISTEKPSLEKWIAIANKIANDPNGPGIMQQKHFMTREKLGGPHAAPYWWIDDEINLIRRVKKDTKENMTALRMWLRADNYNSEADVYTNDFFIYDPTNVNYQRLSQSFWDVYSTEQYGWRDQPLWAHFLDKLGITPVPLTDGDIGMLTDGRRDGKKGFGKHGITTKYADGGMLAGSRASVSRRLDEREIGRDQVAHKLAAQESIASMLG